MSNSKKDYEPNDFWNDCLNENIIYNDPTNNGQIKKIKNVKISSISNYSTKGKRKRNKNKKLYKYNTKLTFPQSEIIKHDLLIEESNKPENNKKIIKSIEHMISLYKRAISSQETKKAKIVQNNEKTIKLEKERCSFKPKLFRNKIMQKKLQKDYGESTIYERGLKYQQKKMDKMAKLFEEHFQKENVVYPFHPNVTYKDLNQVFYSDNFFREQAENDSNKIFLFRLMKAREEKEYKKYCLENYVSKKLEINWSCPKKLKRSVSQKDSLLIQKKLHNNILNLKCLETNSANSFNDV
jgi:hypothetical protein